MASRFGAGSTRSSHAMTAGGPWSTGRPGPAGRVRTRGAGGPARDLRTRVRSAPRRDPSLVDAAFFYATEGVTVRPASRTSGPRRNAVHHPRLIVAGSRGSAQPNRPSFGSASPHWHPPRRSADVEHLVRRGDSRGLPVDGLRDGRVGKGLVWLGGVPVRLRLWVRLRLGWVRGLGDTMDARQPGVVPLSHPWGREGLDRRPIRFDRPVARPRRRPARPTPGGTPLRDPPRHERRRQERGAGPASASSRQPSGPAPRGCRRGARPVTGRRPRGPCRVSPPPPTPPGRRSRRPGPRSGTAPSRARHGRRRHRRRSSSRKRRRTCSPMKDPCTGVGAKRHSEMSSSRCSQRVSRLVGTCPVAAARSSSDSCLTAVRLGIIGRSASLLEQAQVEIVNVRQCSSDSRQRGRRAVRAAKSMGRPGSRR